MFSYHTYLGLCKHLLSQLEEHFTLLHMARAEISIRHVHTFHVNSITIFTFTLPIHRTTLFVFLMHPYSVTNTCTSRDSLVTCPYGGNPNRYFSRLCTPQKVSVKDQRSQATFPHTYLLTPWSRVLLEKLTSKLCS